MVAKLSFKIRELYGFFFRLYFFPIIILTATTGISIQTNTSFSFFTRDMAVIGSVHPLAGVISNIGALLWTTSAAICIFSWSVLQIKSEKTELKYFFLCFGLMTILLMADDFFLLHEFIFPKTLGISEKTLFIVYAAAIPGGLIIFRKTVLNSEYIILLVALGFFALSLFVDAFQYQIELRLGDWRIFFEDGFKFLGIIGWLGYFYKCCFTAVTFKEELS